MYRSIAALVFGLGLLVTACGSSTGDRTLSGAGIGAAAGGLTGALTSEDVVNLGDPIWASNTGQANGAAVSQIQAGLTELGYNPGPIDGTMGSQTNSAIRAYQRDNKLLVDGRPTYQLAQHIDNQLKTASG